jgi:tRNA (guanine26-N2/guanine27-N2)-dimethyltransferase
MALDRDLGVAFVRALGRPLGDGWEATAATGVRGLRLLREAAGFRSFVFTEASPRTFEVLRANVAGEPRATALLADGSSAPPGAPFGYVDVDPYGSPLPFLPAALAATRTGGVLAVSATDMPVLAGAQPSACRRRYGAEPVRGRLGPEGALRILLMVLAREARRGGRSARPLLAYVGGHHVRAYVELREGTPTPDPVGTIDPQRWTGPSLGTSASVGPLWLGPIVDHEIAPRLAVPGSAERPREAARFLELLRDDAEPLPPFYYEANALASVLALPSPPPRAELLRALQAAGYHAARTHVRPEGIRTDAPRSTVEDVARSLAGRAQSQKARVRA